jgi:hypothetical protein
MMIISVGVLFCRHSAGPWRAKAGHVSLYTSKRNTTPRQGSDAGVAAPGLRPEMQINAHNLLVLLASHALSTCLYCMNN